MLGLIAAAGSVLWTMLTFTFAHFSHMLYPDDMLRRFPNHQIGLPAKYHGGLVDDLFLFTIIVWLVIGLHGAEWGWSQMSLMLVIGSILSGAMHLAYIGTPFPDPLAWKETGITMAGWLHVIYMSFGFAIVGLFYFCSTPSTAETVLVSVLLALHVAIGNHVLVGWLNLNFWHYEWMPDFTHSPTPWVTIGITCVALVILSGATSGLVAAELVSSLLLTAIGVLMLARRTFN